MASPHARFRGGALAGVVAVHGGGVDGAFGHLMAVNVMGWGWGGAVTGLPDAPPVVEAVWTEVADDEMHGGAHGADGAA